MHGKADVHGTVQVRHGFGFAQSGASDFVSHVHSIGGRSGGLWVACATFPTVTPLLYRNVRTSRTPYLYLSGCNLQRSEEHKHRWF